MSSKNKNRSMKDYDGQMQTMALKKLVLIAASVTPRKDVKKKRVSGSSPNSGQIHKMSKHAESTVDLTAFVPILNELKYKSKIPVSATRNQTINLTEKKVDLVCNVPVDIWQRDKFDTHYQIIPNDGEICQITVHNTISMPTENMEKIPITEVQFKNQLGSSPWVYGNVETRRNRKLPAKALNVENKDNVPTKKKIPPVKPPRKSKTESMRAKNITPNEEDIPGSPQAVSQKLNTALNLKRTVTAHTKEIQPDGLEKTALRKSLRSLKRDDSNKDTEALAHYCSVVNKSFEFLDSVTSDDSLLIHLTSKSLHVSENSAPFSDLSNIDDQEQLWVTSMAINCKLSRWDAICDLSNADISICSVEEFLTDDCLPLL